MGTMHKPLARRVVPEEMQRKLKELIFRHGKARLCTMLACSTSTLEDAIGAGGTLRPGTLAKLQASLARVEAA
jgi:hypothetical protein